MEDLEQKCFEIIKNIGAARSSFVESIEASKNRDFELAKRLIEEGERHRKKGQKIHFDLITKEDTSSSVKNTTLLRLHTEDQLMNSEVIKILSETLFDLYKIIHKN